jgi:HTH-type transcriptional regulator/antitoxin HigA
MIGRTPRVVNELMSGKASITPEMAAAIGEALGTGAQIWLNIQTAYNLSLVRQAD